MVITVVPVAFGVLDPYTDRPGIVIRAGIACRGLEGLAGLHLILGHGHHKAVFIGRIVTHGEFNRLTRVGILPADIGRIGHNAIAARLKRNGRYLIIAGPQVLAGGHEGLPVLMVVVPAAELIAIAFVVRVLNVADVHIHEFAAIDLILRKAHFGGIQLAQASNGDLHRPAGRVHDRFAALFVGIPGPNRQVVDAFAEAAVPDKGPRVFVVIGIKILPLVPGEQLETIAVPGRADKQLQILVLQQLIQVAATVGNHLEGYVLVIRAHAEQGKPSAVALAAVGPGIHFNPVDSAFTPLEALIGVDGDFLAGVALAARHVGPFNDFFPIRVEIPVAIQPAYVPGIAVLEVEVLPAFPVLGNFGQVAVVDAEGQRLIFGGQRLGRFDDGQANPTEAVHLDLNGVGLLRLSIAFPVGVLGVAGQLHDTGLPRGAIRININDRVFRAAGVFALAAVKGAVALDPAAARARGVQGRLNRVVDPHVVRVRDSQLELAVFRLDHVEREGGAVAIPALLADGDVHGIAFASQEPRRRQQVLADMAGHTVDICHVSVLILAADIHPIALSVVLVVHEQLQVIAADDGITAFVDADVRRVHRAVALHGDGLSGGTEQLAILVIGLGQQVVLAAVAAPPAVIIREGHGSVFSILTPDVPILTSVAVIQPHIVDAAYAGHPHLVVPAGPDAGTFILAVRGVQVHFIAVPVNERDGDSLILVRNREDHFLIGILIAAGADIGGDGIELFAERHHAVVTAVILAVVAVGHGVFAGLVHMVNGIIAIQIPATQIDAPILRIVDACNAERQVAAFRDDGRRVDAHAVQLAVRGAHMPQQFLALGIPAFIVGLHIDVVVAGVAAADLDHAAVAVAVFDLIPFIADVQLEPVHAGDIDPRRVVFASLSFLPVQAEVDLAFLAREHGHIRVARVGVIAGCKGLQAQPVFAFGPFLSVDGDGTRLAVPMEVLAPVAVGGDQVRAVFLALPVVHGFGNFDYQGLAAGDRLGNIHTLKVGGVDGAVARHVQRDHRALGPILVSRCGLHAAGQGIGAAVAGPGVELADAVAVADLFPLLVVHVVAVVDLFPLLAVEELKGVRALAFNAHPVAGVGVNADGFGFILDRHGGVGVGLGQRDGPDLGVIGALAEGHGRDPDVVHAVRLEHGVPVVVLRRDGIGIASVFDAVRYLVDVDVTMPDLVPILVRHVLDEDVVPLDIILDLDGDVDAVEAFLVREERRVHPDLGERQLGAVDHDGDRFAAQPFRFIL